MGRCFFFWLTLVGPVAAQQAPNPLPPGLFADETPPFDPAAADDPAKPAPGPEGPAPQMPSAPLVPSSSATPMVRLIYAPGPFAPVCPSADDVSALVRRHLGYDPFGEPATRVVLLALDGTGGAPDRARVELLETTLTPLGSRVVNATDGCAELVATAALQISIALDPMASSTPAAPSPAEAVADPAGPSAPPPPSALGSDGGDVAPVPAPAILETVNVDEAFYLGVGMHVAALLAPEGAMVGMTVGAGGRWSAVSARGELRFDISGDDRGTTSFPIILSVIPCAHLPLMSMGEDGDIELTGCLTASAGIMPAVGTYTGFGLYAGSGARVGIDWRFPKELTLRTFGQLEAAGLRPTLINVGSGNIYQSPGFNVLLGMGMDLPEW